MDYNDKIIEKIRNLLELAEDGAHDEESQTALLMAQKLMLKYKISQNQLSDVKPNEIMLKSLSFYKRVYWWEKLLVRVIADNFRVMFYLQSNRLPHQSGIQRKVVLMGYEEDVELAYEMFHLAANAMKYFVHLASGPTCPVQIIRYGDTVWATQFHGELDAESMGIRMAFYKNHGYFRPEEYDDIVATLPAYDVSVAQQLLRNFIGFCTTRAANAPVAVERA